MCLFAILRHVFVLPGILVMTVATIVAGHVYFKFLLIPFTMAYFFTFVLGPLYDLFYQRPLLCGRPICLAAETNEQSTAAGFRFCSVAKDGKMWRGHDGHKPMEWAVAEIFLLGRLPQGLALLATLAVAGGGTIFLAYAIYSQIKSLAKTADGEDSEFVVELYRQLGDLREYLRNNHFAEIEEFNLKNTSIENPTHYNMSSFLDQYGSVYDSISEFILIMLLCIYMLSARRIRTVDDDDREQNRPHEMSLVERIESSIKHYVILKAKISFLTGVVVMVALMLLHVKLWLVWGVLTFILNFIPNVGSLIAMLLPLPVALADTTLSPWQKALAFLIPGFVQGYVGNVLEPSLFGKSLNLTDISVLSTLVLWYSLWGVYGAILSVPLLGVVKLLLDAADFPLAQMVLQVIRQDKAVDEGLERTRTGSLNNLILIPGLGLQNQTSISTSQRGDFLKNVATATVAARQHRLHMNTYGGGNEEWEMEEAQAHYHTDYHNRRDKTPYGSVR